MSDDDDDLVRFVREETVRAAAAALFERERATILALLPDADVQHVGSTAVPGALTKGDLDLVVRVAPKRFTAAEAALAAHYARNTGSTRTAEFAAFKNDAAVPPLGVQLAAIGGASDFFVTQRELMLAEPALARAYDDLKRRFEGRRMADYRAAKDVFFEELAAELTRRTRRT